MENEEEVNKKTKQHKHRLDFLDSQVKSYLEKVWLERSRWIHRRNQERQDTREVRILENMRDNALTRWLHKAEVKISSESN